ncbi:hypothetical protein ARMSODRAFT_983258 [Armillaria solidipes]|uniref:Uncharacterized protein n=1 Tax=Armillaria solidipes TaxID=1076256 RepID=A0A2H3AQY2_9AGAR|nr:hypothetical protein ARMSODRAFT_983258 [Armillaria solidipes]
MSGQARAAGAQLMQLKDPFSVAAMWLLRNRRFGPSPPGAMSPARSTSSIDFTESLRSMAPLDNPSPSANDDSVPQMDTDVHDNGTVSATAPNVEDAEPQSSELEAVSNESSRSSVTPLGDNEIDRRVCKDPAPTGKENVRPLRDRKATQRADGPDWRDTTKAELLSNEFGSDWEDCITQWHEFEGMVTTNSNGRFYSGGRPKKLSSWLSSKSRLPFKSKNWDPEEIDVFGNKTEAWWNQAQPKWRQTAKELQGNQYSGDLSAFRKGGRSGISTFLFGLQLWRVLQPDSHAWTEIVRDITMCLNVNPKGARSRGLEDEEPLGRMPRKRVKT